MDRKKYSLNNVVERACVVLISCGMEIDSFLKVIVVYYIG